MRIPFGIYAGHELAEVPPSYLHWAVTHVPLSLPMQEEIKRILRESGAWTEGEGVMPMGRYAGFAFVEIPLTYLAWALANMTLLPRTQDKIRAVLLDAGFPEDGHKTDPWFSRKVKAATPAAAPELTTPSPERWMQVAFAGAPVE